MTGGPPSTLLEARYGPQATGDSSVDRPPETVRAFAGRDVILPCSIKITPSDDFPTVEWSKEGLQPNVVFLYRDGCEIHEMKNPAFRYRTSFITEELKDGNIALRISNVQLSDAGKYQCMTLWKNAPRDTTAVELVVVAVSKPKLSVVSAKSGRVTLQCEANCWPLEPNIEFLDEWGNNITADEPKRKGDTSRCYTVTRTLQHATNRVTCRVHQPEINQTRDAEILITGDHMRSSLTTGIAVGEGVLILIAAFGLAFYFLYKRHGKPAKTQSQLPNPSTTNGTSENQPFLQMVQVDEADNAANSAIEELTREVADLKSKLLEKDETIHQLPNDVKPLPDPVVCHPETRNLLDDHHPKPTSSTNTDALPRSVNLPQIQGLGPGISGPNGNPAPDRTVHRNRRINSSPALFNFAAVPSCSSASTSKKKSHRFRRCMSESGAQPGPNIPKLQRRHSFVLSSSDDGFKRLPDLSEESD
ncbi:butyrophilin subfamily 3 member A2-like [Symphorus nematophorus]